MTADRGLQGMVALMGHNEGGSFDSHIGRKLNREAVMLS